MSNIEIQADMMGEITKIGEHDIHPFANIVTIDEDVSLLADSIKRTGLRHPIITYKGRVLDGRRRILACGSIGIEPAINDIGIDKELSDKELYEIVLAENNRRNLSATQRAIVAARETIKGNHKRTLYTVGNDYAKNVWGVGANTFNDAKKLVRDYPAFASELFDGNSVEIEKKSYRGVAGVLTALKAMERKSADTDSNPQLTNFKYHVGKNIAFGYSQGLDPDDMKKAFDNQLDKEMKHIKSDETKADETKENEEFYNEIMKDEK